MSKSNSASGAVDSCSRSLQLWCGSTAHASPAAATLPSVQKVSIIVSHTPRLPDGKNSMKTLNATGTPPRPKPTMARHAHSSSKEPAKDDASPATKIHSVVQKNASFRPFQSAIWPHVGAPKSIPTNTTLVSMPSCLGDIPHSHRAAGPRNESSIISIASPIHASPVTQSITSWKGPKPISSMASSTVQVGSGPTVGCWDVVAGVGFGPGGGGDDDGCSTRPSPTSMST